MSTIIGEMRTLVTAIGESVERIDSAADAGSKTTNLQQMNADITCLASLVDEALQTGQLEHQHKPNNNEPIQTGMNTLANMISKADELFLNRLRQCIMSNIAEPDFDVNRLSDVMNMSRRNLFRKIRQASGLSPVEMINQLRLKRAAELLLQSDCKMYEIAEAVGFRSRIVFTRNFTRQFGLSPTEYGRRK